jgi:PAS domain S-box-containing protein
MSVHEVFVELKDDIVPGAIAMTEMDGTANQIAHGTVEYILTGDAEAKAEVQTASEWLENSLAAHKEHEINIGYLEKKEAEKLEEEGKKLISVANEIINLKDQGVSKEVLLKKENEELQGALHPFVEHVISHKAEHLQELSAAQTRVHGKHDATIRYTIILGLVATLLGLLIGLLVDRLFMRFITERKLAEEKLEHLNAVLLAIRNVNQLIAKEKDRDKLLKGVCENLIETRGYYNSWIALLDKSEGLVTTAEAGLGKDFLPMMELLKAGKLPDCAQKALEQSQVVLTDDPASTCTDCILAKKYSDGGAMTIRLEHGGKAYGLLSASAPRGFVSDAEEQALFKEVAGDIEFALHSIELEEERKQTEEELRESEEKYRTLFEESRDAIYINTREGKFIDANQSYLGLFGYSREEMSERNATDDYVNPDDRIRFADEIDRKGSVKDFEVKYKKKDGTEMDCLVSATVQQSNDGTILGYQGNIRDITERKQAEEALRETEEKYRMLFENAAEAIYVAQDGKIKFPNPRTEELYGYSSEELTSKPFTYFIHEKDQNMVLERHKKRLRGEKPPTIYPFRIVNKAGDTKWVEIKVASFSWENRPATLCFLTDITERKQMEEALRESEEKYRDIFENVSDFLYVHDLDGNLIDTNLAWKREYGFTEEDLAHLNVRDLVPERYRNQFDDYLKRVKENGKDEGIIRVMTKDGRERIVEYRNSLLYDSTGPIRVRGSARDLTERKKTEEALRQAAALETLSSVLENFIGDSLSNLLTPIYGQIELCEIRDSIEQIKSELGYAKEGFTKLLTGISAYRKFTKAGESSLGKISSEGISSILGPLLSGQPLKTYGNGEFPIDPSVKLRFTYDPKQKGALSLDELPSVSGSKLAIETALQETLINAVESYDPKKGGDVVVSAKKEDHNLILEIADNGRGMSNEERDKSQLPFFKVLGVKGSDRLGLGAYVALESVKYCGGDIHIESTEGAGTTASISFKVSDQVS